MVIATQRLKSRVKVSNKVVTGTTATTPDWFDMRDYHSFMCVVTLMIKTGDGITLVRIIGNDQAAGAGNDVELATSGAVVADAANDTVVLEVREDVLNEKSNSSGYTLRWVSAEVTMENAADTCCVTSVLEPKHEQEDLTATAIS